MPAVYVHIPFCKQKCVYCDFNSYPGLDAVHGAYIDALVSEISAGAARFNRASTSTIYIGGGTPMLLGPEQIGRVLSAIQANFTVVSDAEISIEANPETITHEKLAALRDAGINRLSMGFQSLDDDLLELLGRKHTAAQAVDAFRVARGAGFENIGIDLIFGIPGQSLANWALTLEQAIALDPEHLSCYGLTIESGTALERSIDASVVASPDEDLQADMLLYTMDSLYESGYEHYEISNYAKPGFACKHNLTYWDGGDYLGFGAGAHSKAGRTRFSNVAEPVKYMESAGSDARIAESVEQSVADEMSEAIFLGLRKMDGVNPEEFHARFDQAIDSVFGEEIEDLVGLGLLARNTNLRLTPRGILLGNEVFSRFV
ncbi:MAG: radical SAM family heme chaperone HemW [Actinobacteria bacterium]|nr:radical SAM family heme chaperone HemW [Actinomycetota bacterium]